jgi:site-specific DNA-methyltransferase (adenine-specific)
MQGLPDGCIPLTVTSPPYDDLRVYGGHHFDYRPVADQLWRVTASGGVVVWVVRDAIVAGSETGTSSEHKVYFRKLGFRIYHTLVMAKPGLMSGQGRHGATLEYAFILSKGKPRTINLLCDWPSKRPGQPHHHRSESITGIFRRRGPIWTYPTGRHIAAEDWVRKAHPALMPEAMARDLIVSWSRPGDLVFDPMAGAGTTCKMALLNHRRYLGMEVFSEYANLARERLRLAHEKYHKELSRWLFATPIGNQGEQPVRPKGDPPSTPGSLLTSQAAMWQAPVESLKTVDLKLMLAELDTEHQDAIAEVRLANNDNLANARQLLRNARDRLKEIESRRNAILAACDARAENSADTVAG